MWSEIRGEIAAAVLLEPGCARRLDGNMCILAKEAKAIRFTGSTAISIKKFLCSPMLGKRPNLVRIGTIEGHLRAHGGQCGRYA